MASVIKALEEGKISKSSTVMLNVTGGGKIYATKKGFVTKAPDLVLDPDLPAEEIIAAVDKLY